MGTGTSSSHQLPMHALRPGVKLSVWIASCAWNCASRVDVEASFGGTSNEHCYKSTKFCIIDAENRKHSPEVRSFTWNQFNFLAKFSCASSFGQSSSSKTHHNHRCQKSRQSIGRQMVQAFCSHCGLTSVARQGQSCCGYMVALCVLNTVRKASTHCLGRDALQSRPK